jgi:glycosyltransferase involved in cell wall biosynthesis
VAHPPLTATRVARRRPRPVHYRLGGVERVTVRELHAGLDLLFLVPGETGGRETYAVELIRALAGLGADLRLTAFVNQELVDTPGFELDERVSVVPVHVRTRRRSSWALGEAVLVPAAATRRRIDLMHGLANFGPLYGPFRRVLSLHDLMFLRVPQLLPLTNRLAARALTGGAAKRAHRVLASSQATATDAIELLGIDPARIDVVPLGLGATPVAPLDARTARTRLGLDERPYVLAPGLALPHKNLSRLVAALSLIPPERRPQLALTAGGDQGRLAKEAALLGVSGDVRVLGWLEPALLEAAYAGAACVAFPSLVEGFGLPVLEAMMRGVPVVCSDIPPLREVAGDCAVFFDALGPGSMARALEGLLADEAERDRLRAAGLAHAAHFSWRATAEGTLRTYERALGRSLREPSRLS